MSRKYRISKNTLKELQAAGLEAPLIASLEHHVGHTYQKAAFEACLDQIGPKPLQAQQRALVLKLSRLSRLRLEYLIPDRGLREWIEALVVALIVASLVRTFLFTPFKIPSGSMEPAILPGDQVFATRFDYGIPIPFTEIKLFSRDVRRGDIIIFPFPNDPSLDFIKRVIAVGGDQLEIRNGQVYINGQRRAEPYAYYSENVLAQLHLQGLQIPAHGPLRVPKGQLFVMGDNRFNSNDSRSWGFVDQRQVKGKARWIFWSHDPKQGWFAGYRFHRIAQAIR